MTKIPVTIRVSYAVLKELLKLPDDVDLLGVPGANDHDGSFALILETPVHHIRASNLRCEYVKDDGVTKFKAFA